MIYLRSLLLVLALSGLCLTGCNKAADDTQVDNANKTAPAGEAKGGQTTGAPKPGGNPGYSGNGDERVGSKSNGAGK